MNGRWDGGYVNRLDGEPARCRDLMGRMGRRKYLIIRMDASLEMDFLLATETSRTDV